VDEKTLRRCQRTAEQSAGRVADRTRACPLRPRRLPPPRKLHPQFRLIELIPASEMETPPTGL